MRKITVSFLLISLLAVLSAVTFAQTNNTLDIAAYFPIRQGDTWTYDWQYRIGNAPAQTVKRTRAFEGREFVNSGMADKLASENGDYALFQLNENGLFLLGAAEMQRNARFVFDPPVAVLTKAMKVGEWLRVTQLAEDGKTNRQFAARYEPLASMNTPMGKFDDCLKVVWTMDDDTQHHETTYFLARGVGIVAYALAIKLQQPHPFEMSVNAALTLTQLQGRTFSNVADIASFASSKKSAPENSKARTLFRKAYENQYTWDKKFPGFEAEFSFTRDGGAPVSGSIRVNRQLQLEVLCADATVKAAVHAELSQFISYRQLRPFDDLYGAEKAQIGFGENNDLISEIIVSDEESAGSSFLIRDREITRVSRSYGRVRFVNQVKSLKTDDGRFLANEAELKFFSNETGAAVGQTVYQDSYEKRGNYWLPTARVKTETSKGKSQTARLVLDNLRYLK